MIPTAWPNCDSAMAAQVRAFDWSSTPLGALDGWSPQLRTLVDLVLRNPMPTALIWGEAGTLLYNDGYAAICGNKHPRTLGGRLCDAWPEAWDFNRSMMAHCRGGQPLVRQRAHFVLLRDSMLRDCWFDLYYTPVPGADGVDGIVATVVETTDQVLAEQARARQAHDLASLNAQLDAQRRQLEAAHHRLSADLAVLRDLFQRSPSFMAVLLGPEHRFELTNAAYDRLIDHRPVQGKLLREALPEVASQGFVTLLDTVYRTGEPFHGHNLPVMLEQDGVTRRRILDFVYQPLHDHAGHTDGIFVVGIDVTERAEAEERLRIAQEAGEIGTFEWYPERRELLVSDVFRRVYGVPQEGDITVPMLLELVDPAYRERTGEHRLAHGSNPLEYAEYPIRRADTGERRWIARKGQPVGEGAQPGTRYLGVVYDITDRMQAEQDLRALNESLECAISREVAARIQTEEALRQAQKMEAVGRLASGVAHDFNNVLQIISGNLQLMQLDPALAAPLRVRLGQTIAAVDRGAKLSIQLLAFARRQPLQPEVTDLGRLLGGLRPLLQRALGDTVVLELAVAPALWPTAVDPNQLENALLNMALNARDAISGAGRLTIRADNVVAGRRGGQVALTISDTGCGMPPEVLAKVFDPFYTTKAPGKGTGLGMSMVYGFVKQSGGEIRIASTPGAGTTITIELPRAATGEPDATPAPAPSQLRGGSETVLVVEDDAAVRGAVVDMLAGLGYRVLTAADGAAALAVLAGARADLLFTDVSMPGPVDSAELVRQARARAPHMAVLLTSGHAADRSLLSEQMPTGVELLPKPYSLARLAQSVRAELERAPASGLPACAATA